jgi:hypothetical protein
MGDTLQQHHHSTRLTAVCYDNLEISTAQTFDFHLRVHAAPWMIVLIRYRPPPEQRTK